VHSSQEHLPALRGRPVLLHMQGARRSVDRRQYLPTTIALIPSDGLPTWAQICNQVSLAPQSRDRSSDIEGMPFMVLMIDTWH
jgi:hypothetical protein